MLTVNDRVENAGKNKDVANIGIPASDYNAFAKWCDRRHKIRRDTIGAVLKWFASQPDAVKTVVLGEPESGLELAYADLLEGLARAIRERVARPNHRPGGVILFGDGTVVEAPKPPSK